MKLYFIRFSLRRYQPYQVQRDSLNSFQNTPKARGKVRKKYENVKFWWFGNTIWCIIITYL